jgi:hypothetical protein
MTRLPHLASAGLAVLFLAGSGALAGTVERLGEPLTADAQAVAIAAVVERPDDWVGKRVRIEGTVDGVCAMKGCWMELVAQDRSVLRVKVDDGVLVFPATATGRPAVAEGTVEIVEMERDAYVAWRRHEAEELEQPFDPVEVGEGPYRIVQLRGLGAEISLP